MQNKEKKCKRQIFINKIMKNNYGGNNNIMYDDRNLVFLESLSLKDLETLAENFVDEV